MKGNTKRLDDQEAEGIWLPTDVRNQNAVLGKTTLDIHRYVGVEAMGGPLPVDPAKDKVTLAL